MKKKNNGVPNNCTPQENETEKGKKQNIVKKTARTKKRKRVLAIFLVCVILAGIGSGGFFLFHKAKAVTNDLTDPAAQAAKESEKSTDSPVNRAILSPNVKMFAQSDADIVNDSIISVQTTTAGIELKTTKDDTELSYLGVGDVFYLEGSADTAFGETFIGKIGSKSESANEVDYIIDTPCVDEVFDVLELNYAETMTNDRISTIEALDGVTVTETSNIESQFSAATVSQTMSSVSPSVSSLDYSPEQKVTVSQTENQSTDFGDALLLNFDIDLLKFFGMEKSGQEEFVDRYTAQEASRITVHTTVTGSCYHRSTCPCVGRSIFNLTLTDAVSEGYEPCYLCNPPVIIGDDGTVRASSELKLTGKLGLESLSFNVDYDWDIVGGGGLENLTVGCDGKFLAEVGLEANLKLEIGGRTTTISLPFGAGNFQGLDEKMFPLAFIGYNGTVTPVATSNEQIRAITSAIPLTVGAMIYIDVTGNISVSSSIMFSYTNTFSYTNEVVKDGQWLCQSTFTKDPKTTFSLKTELKGDLDAHIGASAMLYVFNLNVVELAVARFGGEAEGSMKLEYSTDFSGESGSEFTYDYYARVYCKLMHLEVRLKTRIDFWFVNVSNDTRKIYLLEDITIKEWGKKSPARFAPEVMSFTRVTAKDGETLYYKDTNGKLVCEAGGYREELYSDPFFIICGIDESFVYILKTSEDSGYDVYRINRESKVDKVLIESVSGTMAFDEKCFYYTSSFDMSNICRFNRETSADDMICNLDGNVSYMGIEGDNIYVVCIDGDSFSWIFGGGNSYCVIDKNGGIVADYGEDVPVEGYHMFYRNGYYIATKYSSSGFLRDMANEIYWMSGNKGSRVLAEGISGWNPTDAGIFTTINKPNDGSIPSVDENGDPIAAPGFRIVVYRAQTGQNFGVTDVYSNQAFFTMNQASNGKWYYFDQTENELILYSMNEDFSGKIVEKTFQLDEMRCDLTDCSCVIVDNRLYFYTIPDEQNATVLYRYDII